MKKQKKERGITLIALVVTIIVLLILAGVTIAMVLGQNGIFNKAETAAERTNESQELEQVRLAVLEAKTNYLTGDKSKTFKEELEESINKVYPESTVEEKEVGEEKKEYTITLPNGHQYIVDGSGNVIKADGNLQDIMAQTRGIYKIDLNMQEQTGIMDIVIEEGKYYRTEIDIQGNYYTTNSKVEVDLIEDMALVYTDRENAEDVLEISEEQGVIKYKGNLYLITGITSDTRVLYSIEKYEMKVKNIVNIQHYNGLLARDLVQNPVIIQLIDGTILLDGEAVKGIEKDAELYEWGVLSKDKKTVYLFDGEFFSITIPEGTIKKVGVDDMQTASRVAQVTAKFFVLAEDGSLWSLNFGNKTLEKVETEQTFTDIIGRYLITTSGQVLDINMVEIPELAGKKIKKAGDEIVLTEEGEVFAFNGDGYQKVNIPNKIIDINRQGLLITEGGEIFALNGDLSYIKVESELKAKEFLGDTGSFSLISNRCCIKDQEGEVYSCQINGSTTLYMEATLIPRIDNAEWISAVWINSDGAPAVLNSNHVLQLP